MIERGVELGLAVLLVVFVYRLATWETRTWQRIDDRIAEQFTEHEARMQDLRKGLTVIKLGCRKMALLEHWCDGETPVLP